MVVDPTTSTRNELNALNGEGCLTGGAYTCPIRTSLGIRMPGVLQYDSVAAFTLFIMPQVLAWVLVPDMPNQASGLGKTRSRRLSRLAIT